MQGAGVVNSKYHDYISKKVIVSQNVIPSQAFILRVLTTTLKDLVWLWFQVPAVEMMDASRTITIPIL